MRGVLLASLCGLICLAGVARASPGSPPQSSAGAAYEADEAAMVRSVAAQARRLAGGAAVCIDLRLRGQPGNAASGALRSAQTMRQGGSSGFRRVERALALHSGRAATADRDLDGRELAGLDGSGAPLLSARCPAPLLFTFSRAVQSGEAAFVEVSVGSSCSSGLYFIALRKRRGTWLIEGEYFQAVPGGLGCGQAYPGAETPLGNYLLVTR
jgi:hypothetical protein